MVLMVCSIIVENTNQHTYYKRPNPCLFTFLLVISLEDIATYPSLAAMTGPLAYQVITLGFRPLGLGQRRPSAYQENLVVNIDSP